MWNPIIIFLQHKLLFLYCLYLFYCTYFVMRAMRIRKVIEGLSPVRKGKYQPFLPNVKKWKAFNLFIGMALFTPPRIIIITLSAIMFLICSSLLLIGNKAHIGAKRKKIVKAIGKVVCRVIMFCLGYIFIEK